jgi:signal peptidase I
VLLAENNTLEVSGDSILVNHQRVKNYTVQQNYYFVMGDNRDNAVDSRMYGFLPESKIKGKVLFLIKRAKP